MLSPPIEGHHVVSKRMIEAAIRAGIDAHVMTIERDAKIVGIPQNWTVLNLKKKSRRYVRFSPSLFSAVDELRASLSISSSAKFSDCDLIHVLNVTKEVYVFAHKLMRVKKPLLLHFYHSQYVLTDDIFFIRNMALRFGLFGRVIDNYALTANVSLSKFMVERLGVDPERVHYVPYPIDTDMFKPLNAKRNLREKHGLPSDQPVVAYVGSLHPARGVSILIRSFRNVLSRFPRALLYISHPHHNGEEAYETHLHELIKNSKLQKSVLIVGPSAHIEEVYNLADIVVLPFQRPYWIDPPLVLLEAMSSGAAVVATSVGAINEVANDHENAVFTKAGDPRILAKNIIELIENPSERHKIGQKARETIVQNYSYNVVGNKLLEIYDFILNHLD